MITTDRLGTLLALAPSKRIVVVGDVMLDVYLVGEVDRISPEAPVPVVRVRERRFAAGGAANVAQNVVAIGATCVVVATVGNDGAARTLLDMLNAQGVGTSSLHASDRPTTTKTRIVARGQQVVRVDEEDDADLEGSDIDAVITGLEQHLAGADALILEDYNKGVLVPRVIEAAISAARARRIPIVVDPKFRNFFSFAGATVFKPNRRELEAALGASVDVDHPETMPGLCRQLGVEHLLLTLGERGMVLFSEDGELCRIPTSAREVYDVVGAGDTVSAYLATMLACGASPEEAAVVANLAAGVQVSKRGAASVSAAELLLHMHAIATAQ